MSREDIAEDIGYGEWPVYRTSRCDHKKTELKGNVVTCLDCKMFIHIDSDDGLLSAHLRNQWRTQMGLKRFVVFTGHKDECQSGWNSVNSDFDTEEEALARGKELTHDGEYDEQDDDDFEGDLWCEIVDTDKGKVIKQMGYEVP